MSLTTLSERDVCTKLITPAVLAAGWDRDTQLREEVGFTKGRVIVRGKLVTRGKAKRADYVLYYKPNIPIAIIEAKDDTHSVGDGMQQALDYATTLNIPFVFSSNGRAFLFHDRTGTSEDVETEIPLGAFPGPEALWQGQLECIMEQTTRNQVSIQKQAFFRVVVPPLAEQRRIVARVDELMAICDRLEPQLTSQQEQSRRFLEAVLHEALEAGEVEPEPTGSLA